MSKVSVIIPVYEELPKVIQLCNTILKNNQEMIREVILLDDNSPSFNLPQLMGLPFRVVRNQTNLGFVKNENAGASLATGDFLFFLNSDIEVHKQWLDPAVKLFDNPKVGVVGIKLVFPQSMYCYKCKVPSPQPKCIVCGADATAVHFIQSAGGEYDGTYMPYHRYLGWLSTDRRVNKTEQVSWVTGAALLTRRDVFNKVGGFDEKYGRGYFDDPDYCERVKEIGYEVWYCPEASATHFVGSSMKETSKTDKQSRAAARSFYNNARYFQARWAEKIKPNTPLQMMV